MMSLLVDIMTQLIIAGIPLTRRLFLLPSLSATKIVNAGAKAWPRVPIDMRVDASEGVNGIGESGLRSIPTVGEFQPLINPVQNIRLAPIQRASIH